MPREGALPKQQRLDAVGVSGAHLEADVRIHASAALRSSCSTNGTRRMLHTRGSSRTYARNTRISFSKSMRSVLAVPAG